MIPHRWDGQQWTCTVCGVVSADPCRCGCHPQTTGVVLELVFHFARGFVGMYVLITLIRYFPAVLG